MLGTQIKDARTRAGISQRELAIRARTSQAAISRVESGLEEPSFDRFTQLMATMGWKPTLELKPLAEPDADLARLREQQEMSVQERLDSGLAWIEFSRDLLGTASRG
jgi:transcriptional regulator with XRE-family HTH domain